MSHRADRKELITQLLKGIETGNPDSVSVVNEEKYVQHNPQTESGNEGLAKLFARIAKMNPRVNIVRLFQDGDFVFGHTEYDFSTRRVGFEIFRFEDDQAVEHWDNIQPRMGPNSSGRTMVDGTVAATNGECTEENRELVRQYVADVLLHRQFAHLPSYVDGDLLQHSPEIGDGRERLGAYLDRASGAGVPLLRYEKIHRILAEGSFVLSVCEGTQREAPTAFYDLYRVEGRRIVEHWDTIEPIAPESEWKNANGKF